jgi:hypothetical protein
MHIGANQQVQATLDSAPDLRRWARENQWQNDIPIAKVLCYCETL